MSLPKFSIRELLMLMAIIGLILPNLYRNTFTARRIDLSYNTVKTIVASIEPMAKGQGGHGGLNEAELSYLVPKSSANTFAQRLNAALEKHLQRSGWNQIGTGGSAMNGRLTSFSYDLSNGASDCAVRVYFLDRSSKVDRVNGTEAEHFRFLVVWLQVP